MGEKRTHVEESRGVVYQTSGWWNPERYDDDAERKKSEWGFKVDKRGRKEEANGP